MCNLKEMKEFVSEEIGSDADFRSDVYLQNDYGLSPTIRYDRAEEILHACYEYGYKKIKQGEKKGFYQKFSGWECNTQMSLDRFRTGGIKDLFESIVNDLNAAA